MQLIINQATTFLLCMTDLAPYNLNKMQIDCLGRTDAETADKWKIFFFNMETNVLQLIPNF